MFCIQININDMKLQLFIYNYLYKCINLFFQEIIILSKLSLYIFDKY